MLVTLPRELTRRTLRTLVKHWPQHSPDIQLCFHPKQWASPAGMVGLACLINGLQKAGSAIDVVWEGCETISYWERMGFFRAIKLPSPILSACLPRPSNGRFAELKRVGDIDLVDGVTQELVETLGTSAAGFRTFSHILSEAMNNVCQHSGSFGFSAAQYWPAKNSVEFCIADSGLGLRGALAASHAPNDDAAAIQLALKVGVTSRSPNFGQAHMRNRGVGLSCIERLVSANGGMLEVWSGLGQFDNGTGRSQMTDVNWQGTFIAVEMTRDNLSADFQAVMKQMAAELQVVESESQRKRVVSP